MDTTQEEFFMEISAGAPQAGQPPEVYAALDKQIEQKITPDNAQKESTRKPQGISPPLPVVLNDSGSRGNILNLVA